MLKNYFKIAIRNLSKHKLFSALNIFGLATSMSVCLLLMMILVDQYSYDDFHENGDRIFRVITGKRDKGEAIKIPDMATTSLDLAQPLKEELAFVEKATRLVNIGGSFQIDDKVLYANNIGYAVDHDFLDMFSFGWLEGDKTTALLEPNSIVLTKEAAELFFPEGDVIGRIVKYGDFGTFTITGLMPDPPIRSHIYFDYLVSYATITAMTEEDRNSKLNIYDDKHISRGLVYTLLQENTSKAQFDLALIAKGETYSKRDEKNHYLFQSQSLGTINPGNDLGNEIGTATPKIVLYFLTCLGVLLMLAAAFNYMNLSVARSLKRAKEIGIRKVIGARKKDIVFQFLGEAVLIAFISLLVALFLLELLIPAFYGLDPFVEQVFYLTRTPLLYFGFFCFSLVIGLFAGVFPAFNISSFQPIQSLKQLSNVKLFSKIGIRKALITSQFVLSLIFILIVIIVLQQQKHVLEADLGVRTDNLMNVWMNEEVDYKTFSQQAEQISGVESISTSSIEMLTGGNATQQVRFNDDSDSMNLFYNRVAQNYVAFMEIDLIAGKSFPVTNNSENEKFIILNETATKRMGYQNPKEALGQIIMADTLALSVIGVTSDFYHDNIWFSPIQPFGLRHGGGDYKRTVVLRLSEINNAVTVQAVHDLWDRLSPKEFISAYFTDTRMYHLDKFFRIGSRIIGFIGFLTILISCLGLLGMVIYTVEGKLKEVGIRKVLGASVSSLNWQLSKGFFVLLSIAILVAVPITIFVANLWLQNFVLRISIGPWIVLSGVGIMLFLALLTIASQTFVAVRSNPVNVLKND